MSTTTPDSDPAEGTTRRDFLYIATGAFTAVGTALATWPFIDQMNPTADVLALASIEVDLSPLEPGQAITVKWRGKPAFLRYRTQKEIDQARADVESRGVDRFPGASRLGIRDRVDSVAL